MWDMKHAPFVPDLRKDAPPLLEQALEYSRACQAAEDAETARLLDMTLDEYRSHFSRIVSDALRRWQDEAAAKVVASVVDS
jgi:hypothetical protein